MDMLHMMFGEKSLTKVAGLFGQRAQAESAMARLSETVGLQTGQVRLLGPDDARAPHRDLFGRKLEPEQRGMFRTLLRAHLATAIIGAVLGVLVFWWFYRTQPAVASSPVLAFIAIVFFAIVLAMIIGGLITIRPDHVQLISHVRRALRDNRWAVVVHPVDSTQTEAAKSLLQGAGAEVISSL